MDLLNRIIEEKEYAKQKYKNAKNEKEKQYYKGAYIMAQHIENILK